MMTDTSPGSWLLGTSLGASVVILLLEGLRTGLRRQIGASTAALLWVVVALRLLLPWPLESPWGWPNSWTASKRIKQAGADKDLPLRVSFASAGDDKPVRQTASAKPWPGASSFPVGWSLLRSNTWNLVWTAGVVLALANLLREGLQVRRWAARTVSAGTDSYLQQIFLSIPEKYRRKVELRVTDALEVPTLTGIRQPQIWLPRSLLPRLGAEEIRHILWHEVGHVRRGDLLAQWLCSLACVLHWFNPLVWMMTRWAQAERELACDAWVLTQNKGAAFGSEYGGTLIKVVAQLSSLAARRRLPGSVAMGAAKRNLTRRVREINAFQPTPAWIGWVAIMAAVLAVAVFTSTRAAEPPTDPASSQTPLPVPPKVSSSNPAAAIAPPPVAIPSENPLRIRFATKLVGFSKAAFAQLKEQLKTLPGSWAVEKHVTSDLEPPLIQVFTPDENEKLMKLLNGMSQVDLLSAPSVTSNPGQKATVGLTRDLVFPKAFEHNKPGAGKPELIPIDFNKRELGFTLELEGSYFEVGDVVYVTAAAQYVDVQGWVRLSDGQPVPENERQSYDNLKLEQKIMDGKPVLVTERRGGAQPVIRTQSVEASNKVAVGSTVILGGFACAPDAWRNLHYTESANDEVVLSLTTVTLVNPPPPAQTNMPKPEPAGPPPVSKDNFPFGTPVKDKPGFVASPYAPNAGMVDVHDYVRGQEVRDPFTNNIFLVP